MITSEKTILNELKEIIKTQMLPDGSHIDTSVTLYLERLYEKLREKDGKHHF